MLARGYIYPPHKSTITIVRPRSDAGPRPLLRVPDAVVFISFLFYFTEGGLAFRRRGNGQSERTRALLGSRVFRPVFIFVRSAKTFSVSVNRICSTVKCEWWDAFATRVLAEFSQFPFPRRARARASQAQVVLRATERCRGARWGRARSRLPCTRTRPPPLLAPPHLFPPVSRPRARWRTRATRTSPCRSAQWPTCSSKTTARSRWCATPCGGTRREVRPRRQRRRRRAISARRWR